MCEIQTKEATKLIDNFKRVIVKEFSDTSFLEIIGKSYHENTWSKILAFYLSPDKEHNLFELLIKSLFDTLVEFKSDNDIESDETGMYKFIKEYNFNNLKNYEVKNEQTTLTGNRIDILISSNDFVIGIENKINAPLNNDLDDYYNTIKSLSTAGKKSILIALSKNKLEQNITVKKNDHFFITYEKLLEKIKTNLGAYFNFSNTKYFVFFLDFLYNIDKHLNFNKMIDNNPELVKFIVDNKEDVRKLVEAHYKINYELNKKLSDVIQEIKNNSLSKLWQDIKLLPSFHYAVTMGGEVEINISYNQKSIIWMPIAVEDYAISIEYNPNSDNCEEFFVKEFTQFMTEQKLRSPKIDSNTDEVKEIILEVFKKSIEFLKSWAEKKILKYN